MAGKGTDRRDSSFRFAQACSKPENRSFCTVESFCQADRSYSIGHMAYVEFITASKAISTPTVIHTYLFIKLILANQTQLPPSTWVSDPPYGYK